MRTVDDYRVNCSSEPRGLYRSHSLHSLGEDSPSTSLIFGLRHPSFVPGIDGNGRRDLDLPVLFLKIADEA